ncbi:MAG TPA: hypothetical protein PKA31_04015 [Candidatus Moranbacteria bacterium]|nr:hypothetical protein [Candidatus Moranbacteria bacterium]
MHRKTLKTLAVIVFVFGVATFIKASAAGNTLGWLWGGSESVSDGTIDGNESGLGWISMSGANYGVTIPSGDGPLGGYAWSENAGWIDFAPAGPYPQAPNFAARRNGDILEGWARIVSIAQASAVGNSGGWQGWIKLSGTAQNGTSYGISINPVTRSLGGYAWSDELGAIDFSKASINPQYELSVSVGNGTVTSTPAGISCNSGVGVCQVSFPQNTVVTLSQTPDVTYEFNSWGGACSGNGTCSVTMDSNKTVSATYNSTCNICPAANEICAGSSCDPGCGQPLVNGTKNCINVGTYKEVAP